MKNNVNIFDEFDEFDSEDFQTYQNRLLLRVLETILAQKGYLKAQDIDDAYAQCWVPAIAMASLSLHVQKNKIV